MYSLVLMHFWFYLVHYTQYNVRSNNIMFFFIQDLELAKKNNTITTAPKTLSSIEIHSLVREKLEKKGVHIDKKGVQNNPLVQYFFFFF